MQEILFIVRSEKTLQQQDPRSLAWWWQQKLNFYYNFIAMFFIAYNFSNFLSFPFRSAFSHYKRDSSEAMEAWICAKTILFISNFIEWKILLFITIWLPPGYPLLLWLRINTKLIIFIHSFWWLSDSACCEPASHNNLDLLLSSFQLGIH